MPHRRARDERQRRRRRIVGLVDMQIDVEPVPRCQRKHAIQKGVDIVERRAVIADRGARHAAEQAARFCDDRSHPVAELIRQQIDRAQGDRLKVHPALPFLAHLPQHAPAALGGFMIGVDMRADRRDAVRVGATQAEIHAPAQIRLGPIRPIRGRGKARIEKRAVDVRTALDGVAFVEMGVNVDQGRPNLAAADVDARQSPSSRFSAGRSMRASLPSSINRVRLHHAFRINRRRQSYAVGQQTGGHARIRKPIAARGRPDDVSESDRHRRHRGG